MTEEKRDEKKPKAGSQKDYHHPAAAWGAALSVAEVMLKQQAVISGTEAIFTMNQPRDGFDCPGCAWPDDQHGLKMDICENGIKHVAWEMTPKRADREFFARHTVSELATWSEFELEDVGRLTEPMSYNATTDKYEPISWADAFKTLAKHMHASGDPNRSVFYTSGRLSNEGTFLYQLFAREFGTNNLPDCSNMCHEASGRALKASLGTGKGTIDMEDWLNADCIFVIGVNAATNTPRMLSGLVEGVRKHDMKIVHINPLIEAAATSVTTPHEIMDMLTFNATPTSSLNLQPRIGGDMAVMRGIGKYLFELAESDDTVLDHAFIRAYTNGFEDYKAACERTSWADIEKQSGLKADQIKAAAKIYREAKAAIISWCLGISQQKYGVDTIREIVNLLLLRGNLGRLGAGACPIRGHSNVQGNRTCGIDNRVDAAWLDRMDAACNISSPRVPGYNTVQSIEAMYEGKVDVFFGMGGNFAICTPDSARTFAGLRKCALTAHVSTKLNRSHIVHGREALILPCLGRTEKDLQNGIPQEVSVEDSFSMIHLSRGKKKPASEHLLSEPAILCGMARAVMPQSKTPWEAYCADYDKIRDKIGESIAGFEDFNRHVRHRPGGFRLRQVARELVFRTQTERANFSAADLHDTLPPPGMLMMSTVRSHDQFNTTIYSDNDRYRGVKNMRNLLFMNEEDMKERGIETMELIDITSKAVDGTAREVKAFHAVRYNIPRGCATGYMPELNVLLASQEFSKQSDQPLMKQILIEVRKSKASG